MAEGEDKDSKTEEPTEKKIRDALDKGNVPFSREVATFASTMGMLVFLVFFLPSSASRFSHTLRDLFEHKERYGRQDMVFVVLDELNKYVASKLKS